jgi:hypothetical protein
LGDGDNDQGDEKLREKAEIRGRRSGDLDETRRPAYMALVAGTTSRPELVATLANALAHHGLQVPFQEAVTHLAVVVRGELQGESGRWLQAQIARLTTELDAENTHPS